MQVTTGFHHVFAWPSGAEEAAPSTAAWLAPTSVRLVEGAACEAGHPVEDLTCAYCGTVRYRGSICEHVAPPSVLRRKWDNLPLCADCLRG